MLVLLIAAVTWVPGISAAQQSPVISDSENSVEKTVSAVITRPIREILSGDWTPSVCTESHRGISFSDDGKQMFIVSRQGLLGAQRGGMVSEVATYQILEESERVLRMQMDKEDRLDEDGNPVVWDLVLINEDTFCWHRTDWRAGSCTLNRVRCPE